MEIALITQAIFRVKILGWRVIFAGLSLHANMMKIFAVYWLKYIYIYIYIYYWKNLKIADLNIQRKEYFGIQSTDFLQISSRSLQSVKQMGTSLNLLKNLLISDILNQAAKWKHLIKFSSNFPEIHQIQQTLEDSNIVMIAANIETFIEKDEYIVASQAKLICGTNPEVCILHNSITSKMWHKVNFSLGYS